MSRVRGLRSSHSAEPPINANPGVNQSKKTRNRYRPLANSKALLRKCSDISRQAEVGQREIEPRVGAQEDFNGEAVLGRPLCI